MQNDLRSASSAGSPGPGRPGDLSVSLGVAMTVEDFHRPPRPLHPNELLFTSTDFNSYVTGSNAEGAPTVRDAEWPG